MNASKKRAKPARILIQKSIKKKRFESCTSLESSEIDIISSVSDPFQRENQQ